MALTSFTAWFSAPSAPLERNSVAGSNVEERETPGTLPVPDENEPPSSLLGFTFTPTNVKQRPRAWQRKPATPFAPRTESQRIWKRVPLQNVASNVNAAWQRGGKAGDGIMRPVKKLRVAAAGGENTGIVCSASAQWDCENSPARTPRRRRAGIRADTESHGNKLMVHAQSATISSPSPGMEKNFQRPSEHDVSDDASQLSDRDSEESSKSSARSPQDFSDHPDNISEQHIPQGSSPSPESEVPKLAIEHCSILQLNEVIESENVSDLEGAKQSSDDGAANTGSRHPVMQSEDLHEHVEVTSMSEAEQADGTFPKSRYFLQNHIDDASYLQAFLSRSRAQREAKSQPGHPIGPSGPDVALVPAGLQLPSNSPVLARIAYNHIPIESVSLPALTPDGEDDQEVNESTDPQASSPSRRSSRITRLPRPQKPTVLPSTISLRRLNGTEFIAMQKESQSLAIATRANTKRNKGSSLNVKQRLVQLQAEKHPSVDDKRPKNGKGVEWSEMIAKMQGEDGSEVVYVPEPKLEGGPANGQFEEQFDPQEGESEPAPEERPVRRRRKESLGNVNGTPAPKKTLELLLENANQSLSTGKSTEDPQPTPIKRPRTRARSQR